MNPLKNLPFLLKSRGITQISLAQKIGVDRQTLRMWIQGLNPVPIDKLLLIFQEINYSLSYSKDEFGVWKIKIQKLDDI